MIKLIIVALGLLAGLLSACSSVADRPPEAATQATDPAVQEARPLPASSGSQASGPGPSAAEPSPAAAAATPIPELGFDDARVEGLVAEWETDLAAINRVADCVERELGLQRPLLPEDFALQANQPAILSCVKREVGNE